MAPGFITSHVSLMQVHLNAGVTCEYLVHLTFKSDHIYRTIPCDKNGIYNIQNVITKYDVLNEGTSTIG